MELGKLILESSRKYNQVPDSHFSDILLGTVTEINPIKIKVGDKLILTEKNLILGALVKETYRTFPDWETPQFTDNCIPGGAGDAMYDAHNHQISNFRVKLWRGLIVGDVVYLLRVAKAQTYFVLQREEGID